MISEQRILLCDLVEPIARALFVYTFGSLKWRTDFGRYGNVKISSGALMEMSEKATSAMFSWKDNLPEPLNLVSQGDIDVTPQVLVLLYVQAGGF